MKAVAAEEAIVRQPDEDEEEEAGSEGQETEQDGMVELVVGAWNFERDDEQGDGEAEDDVGEAVDARGGGPRRRKPSFAMCWLRAALGTGYQMRVQGPESKVQNTVDYAPRRMRAGK